MLTVDGSNVTHSGRDMFAGLKPCPVGVSPRGDFVVTTAVGMGNGASDTMSLIDMTLNPPRIVDTVSAGPPPDSISISPDGKFVAVTMINGTNKPKDSPFFQARGAMPVFAVRNTSGPKH